MALKTNALKPHDLTKISVDTTVQEKAITFPTDAKLRYKALIGLGDMTKEHGIGLHQSYLRVAKQTMIMAQRYRHAKQMRRARKAMRKLHTYLGWLIRNVKRRASEMSQNLLEAFLKPNAFIAKRLMTNISFHSGILLS